MTSFTIFGRGAMAQAINMAVGPSSAGTTQHIGGDEHDTTVTGEVVVLAVPYPALREIAQHYGDQLRGRIVVDITNPLDFGTFDSLVVPSDSSAAQELAGALPGSRVLKAFNTNFAATITERSLGKNATSVLIAGDDQEAKETLAGAIRAGGLKAFDVGSLARARELEALGFLQLRMAASEQVPWTGGFAVVD